MGINTKATLSDSAVELMNKAVIISGNSYNKIDPYVTVKQDDMASTITFTVFSRMGYATTPLTDGTEATSTTMTDTAVKLEPAEYGSVITSTSLANLATAGKADLASAELVGINVGETTDKLGLLAIEAGTNTIAAATAGTLTSEDLRAAYEALANAGIAKFADGRYVAFVNPSQISDVKDDFIAIVQNTNAEDATSGMVGALEGFTLIEDSNTTAGKVSCFGYNALGKAVSKEAALVVTDGNDNLNRTMNIGWYGVLKYDVIDQNALRVITGA